MPKTTIYYILFLLINLNYNLFKKRLTKTKCVHIFINYFFFILMILKLFFHIRENNFKIMLQTF